jgi:hypothetical protein
MSAQCVAPGEVIIPWNEPEVRPVATFTKRTVVKLRVAPANRPVPPVTVFISVMERTPGAPDGSLDPTIVVKMLSPIGLAEWKILSKRRRPGEYEGPLQIRALHFFPHF